MNTYLNSVRNNQGSVTHCTVSTLCGPAPPPPPWAGVPGADPDPDYLVHGHLTKMWSSIYRGYAVRGSTYLADMITALIIAITVCLPCPGLHAANSDIHQQMTEEELTFYFGDMSPESMAAMYDVGSFRKVKKPENLLTRVLGTADSREEYEFKAAGLDSQS